MRSGKLPGHMSRQTNSEQRDVKTNVSAVVCEIDVLYKECLGDNLSTQSIFSMFGIDVHFRFPWFLKRTVYSTDLEFWCNKASERYRNEV